MALPSCIAVTYVVLGAVIAFLAFGPLAWRAALAHAVHRVGGAASEIALACRATYIHALRLLLRDVILKTIWGGRTNAQICAALTRFPEAMWERNEENAADCAEHIDREIDGKLEIAGLALLAFLAYKTFSWITWHAYVFKPMMATLDRTRAALSPATVRRLIDRLSPQRRRAVASASLTE